MTDTPRPDQLPTCGEGHTTPMPSCGACYVKDWSRARATTPRPDRTTLEEIAGRIAVRFFPRGQGSAAGWQRADLRSEILAALSSVQARTREAEQERDAEIRHLVDSWREEAHWESKAANVARNEPQKASYTASAVTHRGCASELQAAAFGTREAARDEGEQDRLAAELRTKHEQRLEQIKAALATEWRLKAEHGIHHDHLSDLAFLIAELEIAQSRQQKVEAQLATVRRDTLREAAEDARKANALKTAEWLRTRADEQEPQP